MFPSLQSACKRPSFSPSFLVYILVVEGVLICNWGYHNFVIQTIYLCRIASHHFLVLSPGNSVGFPRNWFFNSSIKCFAKRSFLSPEFGSAVINSISPIQAPFELSTYRSLHQGPRVREGFGHIASHVSFCVYGLQRGGSQVGEGSEAVSDSERERRTKICVRMRRCGPVTAGVSICNRKIKSKIGLPLKTELREESTSARPFWWNIYADADADADVEFSEL